MFQGNNDLKSCLFQFFTSLPFYFERFLHRRDFFHLSNLWERRKLIDKDILNEIYIPLWSAGLLFFGAVIKNLSLLWVIEIRSGRPTSKHLSRHPGARLQRFVQTCHHSVNWGYKSRSDNLRPFDFNSAVDWLLVI